MRHVFASLKIAAIWFAVLMFLGVAAGELSGGGHEAVGFVIIPFYTAALCSVIHITVRLVRAA
ncbi:MAG TPA: hypothetical protein VJ032_08535 [Thermoanaerobaculia bacterium]|nr:hypothetical protein [Thermoanaerobaculia bacterium]